MYINSQHNVLYYGLVKNEECVTSCCELEMIDEHTTSVSSLCSINLRFTPKSSSTFRSALHFRYSIVIPRIIPHANTDQFL